MDVVILAGGKCSPELEQLSGTGRRAGLPIWGTTMLDIVRGAASPLGRTIIVEGSAPATAELVPAGNSFMESLKNGLDAVCTDRFFLVTADLPFLTSRALEDFVERCDANAMLNYAIVRVGTDEARFGKLKRTSIKLKEGRFTGGNVALIQTEMMRRNIGHMEQAYSLRKKPLKLAHMVGFGTLIRVFAGQIAPRFASLEQLEAAVSRFLGAPVKAIITPFAEIGMDIDDAEQYRILTSLESPHSATED